MTDNEVIKALKHCSADDSWCDDCPYENLCTDTDITKFALDLINRQKAEIERKDDAIHILNDALSEQKDFIERLTGARNTDPMDFCGVLCRYSEELITKAKAEAVKEFAERLKEELEGEYIKATNKLENAQNIVVSTNIKIVDNLVKEMVGEG